MRRGFAALLLVGAAFMVVMVAPVEAFVEHGQEGFTADETASDIERIRNSLYIVAAVTGGLLVIYIWHTNPRRRMDVAIRRRTVREQNQMDSLDDTFALPGDVGVDDDGVGPAGHGQSLDS
ncbi:MAG: hypothetical protein ACPHDT_13435 [Acidimicrobiales bacterium]